MDEAHRVRAEAVIGHQFRDPGLLCRALTHASVAESRVESNERLEFLGDAVLGMVACERIFRRFPTLLEGEMTKIKSAAVSRRACTQIARSLGLQELLILGKGMQSSTQPPSLAAAVLEAVIGAVYVDAGYEAAAAFIGPHIDPIIERAAQSGHQQNFKSVLQQFAQQRFDGTPVYRTLDEKGPDHAKAFKVCVEIDSRRFEPAWGQSKKQAEQQAALLALRALGVAVEDGEGDVRIVESVGAPK